MRKFILIPLLVMTAFAKAQNYDCRDVEALLTKLWRNEIGSAAWIRTSDSVLNICPNSARLWSDRAMGYMIRGEFVEGMLFLNKAAKLEPFYYLGSRAWYRMRHIHDYQGAIKDLDTLENVAGGSFFYVTNVHMYMLKGLSYQQLGNYEKALELYDIAINDQVKTKGDQWVGTYDYLFRGILRYRMKDFDGAIEDLNRQVREYEALADTYYWRGLALAAVGKKDEARIDLQHAKDNMLSNGQRRWDGLFVIPDEVFLSDVESALLKLY
jgi:tetratricopeptide (TPR) repeat protein